MKPAIGYILILLIFAGCIQQKEKPLASVHDGRHVVINGKAIYYEEHGEGIPLILLSGGGLNRSINDFEKCVAGLESHFRIITPDSPGQGKSEQTDSLSYPLLADFFSQLIDSLKLDSVYIMGLSDGAIVALMLADQRKDKVRKIIAVGANNGTRGFTLPAGMTLDSVQIPTVDGWAAYHAKDIEYYNSLIPKKDWRRMAANLNKMWYEKEYFPVSVYGDINTPALIVLGDRDDISLEHGLEMYRAIRNAQFCVLPNTTHEVFSEKPELMNSIALDFFK